MNDATTVPDGNNGAASEIDYAVDSQVAVITLAAPERRNALSVAMAGQLVDAVRTAEADPEVGAVVVTGGAHFCAGAVRDVLADAGRNPVADAAYRNLEQIYASFTAVGTIALPTVAAVRGAAVGAGLNLALATDVRVVSRTARLLPGFAQIGIHPGGGHFTLLNRTAGREASAAMGLFGQEVDGVRAVELGMAWSAHDDAEVLDAALTLARGVAADPDLARRLVASFRAETKASALDWQTAVEVERAAQLWSLHRRHGGDRP